MRRAGEPAYRPSWSRSFGTTAPAATTQPAPMVTPGRISARAPIQQPSAMVTGAEVYGPRAARPHLDAVATLGMRVLTVGNRYPPAGLGGYELVWAGAVRALREAGHEVDVLTTLGGEAGDGVARELHWYWRDHTFVSPSWRERRFIERENARILDRHLREHGSDVVTWWSMGGMSLALIDRAARAGVSTVGVVHDGWMLYGPEVAPSRAPRLGDHGLWTFNSRATLERSRERWTLPRAEVISPGIDPSAFGPAPERPWDWRLLCVGRIEAQKGLATAIEALAGLPDEARLEIIGDGDPAHRRELEALAERVGAAGRVGFTGARPREQLSAAYAAADAVLFPVTWPEPFGLVPLEAMAAGRPVIATGTGGSGEYLRDGENALLVAPGDAEALRAAVERLAADEVLRARLRTGGLATAAQHTEARFHERLIAAIEGEAAK